MPPSPPYIIFQGGVELLVETAVVRSRILWPLMNDVKYYPAFQQCFEELLAVVATAKSRVWLETYCLDRSPAAQQLVEALTNATARGVQCILCVDAFGSLGCLPTDHLQRFRASGGKLCIWNSLLKPHRFFNRNHRKLAVCDDTLYCMSGNFDWRSLRTAEDKTSTRPIDINQALRIRGPVAHQGIESVWRTIRQCKLPFARQLAKEVSCSTTEHVPLSGSDGGGQEFSNVRMTWLEADGLSNIYTNTYREALKTCLEQAKRSIFVASSYFQPPRFLRTRLIAGLSRGIDVKLFLSGRSDVVGDHSATDYILRRNFRKSERQPQIFRTNEQHLHTKTLVVDRFYTVFGSYNWDRFSARRNREAGVLIEHPAIAECMMDTIRKASHQRVEVRDCSKLERFQQWLSYHALRITARARGPGKKH